MAASAKMLIDILPGLKTGEDVNHLNNMKI